MAIVGMRALIGGAALLTAWTAHGTVGIALMFAGAILVVYAVLLGLYLGSLALEARPAELCVQSLFGTRRYVLTKGPVTRLQLPQSWRSPVRGGIGGLGVSVGPGKVYGRQLVWVVALALPRALLIVPTTEGRLAVAPASEEEVLAALAAATELPS